MIDMNNFKRQVRRSLLQRELIAGVPQVGLFILLMLGLIFLYGFRMYIMIVPIVLGYFIMRYLTKKDQWLIDIGLDNLMQKDRFIP